VDEESPVLLPPEQRQFGRYVLLHRLGQGGMAELFLARVAGPGGFKKFIAIKRIRDHLCDNEQFLRMFLDEARVAARIAHPNVVQVIDLGEYQGTFFIAMEYVNGESLASLLTRSKPPQRLVVRIVSQATAGLHAAHELRDTTGDPLGVVHRDVSLGNILISYDGAVKVTDFGVARARGNLHITQKGQFKGKFSYVSPEQVLDEELDRRADIFSLGVVLYEATTYRRLFRGDSKADTLAKVLRKPIPPPSEVVEDYPPNLERIVMKALERDKTQRYQTAQQLHEELEAHLATGEGLVLQSSVARLMSVVFADRISERDAVIKRCEEEMGGLPERLTGMWWAMEHTAVEAGRKIRGRNSMIVAAVAVLAAALVIYGVLFALREDEPRPVKAAKPARAATIGVSIRAAPRKASITFDGKRVHNPFNVTLPKRDGSTEAVIAAPGYHTHRFDVSLARGGHFEIALKEKPRPRRAKAAAKKQPRKRPRRRPRRGRKGRKGRKGTKYNKIPDSPY